ncbi:MAG: hypothetical protein HND55_07785 [Pseudomonadota bacterium]|nr:MAG: hypothetical protein HND55_07785 [Pseudomonadota bacterium]
MSNTARHWSLSCIPALLAGMILSAPADAQQQVEVFDSPGNHTFTVPAGVTEITVEVWGGGGRGGSASGMGRSRAAGGGGGAYARSIFSVVEGQGFDLFVGAGSVTVDPAQASWFASPATVLAAGGESVANNGAAGAAGGQAGSSIGDVRFSGGAGADTSGVNAGGGGSSAGTSSDGTDAQSSAGASAPPGGGDGGDGNVGFSGGGSPGESPGGGGGGATSFFFGNTGGAGGDGQVIITYEVTAEPPAELTGEWRMDEPGWDGSTGEIVDSSGNGNHATARTAGSSNSLPGTVPGKVCNAGRFRGQGFSIDQPPWWIDAQHYADAAHDASLSPLADVGGLSIGGWFQLKSAGGKLLHKGEGGNTQEYQVFVDGGQLRFTLWDRWGGPSTFTVSPQALSSDTWYFFTVTAWQLPASDDIRVRGYLYDQSSQIGGVSEQTLTVDYTNKVTSARLFLAAESFGGSPVNFFDGLLDEIRIHSGILDDDGVEAHWATTRPCPETQELLLEYRMEQTGWTGTAGEVLDTSGFDRHGTALGDTDTAADDPAIVGNPGTCRYGILDGGGDGVVDPNAADYLEGLDAITVMAWVHNTAALSANDRGIFYTNDPSGGRDNRLGMRYDADGFFGGGSNVIKASVFTDDCSLNGECHQVETVSGVMVEDQWQHVAMTWRSGESIKVYVDGSEVGISAVHGPGANGTIAGIDRLELGFGAKSERWQGYIDEFRVFEGVLETAQIQEQMNATFPCEFAGPDHIRLVHPATGLTCSPSIITVEACADADCTTNFPDPVEVDFVSPAGSWIPDPALITESGSVTLHYTTTEAVILDAVATNPAADNPRRCFSGGVETSCEMTFLESGFIIDVPDHVADLVVSGSIAAVKADPLDPEQCVPGFDNETRDINFWSGFVNPSTGSLAVSIDGSSIAAAAPGTATPVAFDDNGVGSFSLQYPDVGDIELNARFEGSGDEAGLVMVGQGRFVARPARFALDIPGNPAATDETGAAFTTAGTPFEVTVAALNASDQLTPNFGQETPAEAVDLELSLVAPSGGADPVLAGNFGAFGVDCNGSNAAAGTACGGFSWPEVGIVSLTPRLASGAYLGSVDVIGTAVDHLGRFIPDHFELDSGSINNRAGLSGCSGASFSYIGERFDADFSLYARNADGNTTTNYEGLFAFLGDGDLNLSGSPVAPGITNSRIDWILGSGDAAAELMLPRSALEGPYPNYQVTTAPVDSDGVSISGNDVIGSTELRFGRIVIDNAIGSELGPVDLPWRADFWDGVTWRVNAADDCTIIDPGAEVQLTSSGGDAGDGNSTVSLGGGSTAIDTGCSVLALGGTPPACADPGPGAGRGRFRFSAPGAPGWVDLALQLDINWEFLRDDLSDDGLFEQNPEARADFGLHEGNRRRIFLQEVTPR